MVKVRNREGRWQVDIRFRWPDGSLFRERKNTLLTSKSGAQRWGQAREAELLAAGKPVPAAPEADPVKTLGEFWPRVVTDWYVAQRKKHSTVSTAKTIYKVWLSSLAHLRLDEITTAEIAALKGRLAARGKKTTNNVLSVLSRVLKCAREWDELTAPLPKFGLLAVSTGEADFYERDVYRRLVDAARLQGRRRLLLVLLGGSCGLRRGEIISLRWHHVDFARRQLKIERGSYDGHEDTPKGGRGRVVPLTDEVHEALTAHKHLVGDRVLYNDDNRPLTNRTIRNWMAAVQKRAGVEATGEIHILRHTYGSHLAMAGVPAKVIQELMGHADLKTTLRYMHLAPGNRAAAAVALDKFYGGDVKERRTA